MTTNTDHTLPSSQYTFDINKSPLYVKDNQNLINVMGKDQMNTLENTSLLDIFLSVSNVVEPHYHPNAAELVYCISGSATVSILNPLTNQLMNFPITPGQAANVPRALWHYEAATMDNTHLLAIFDAPYTQVALGSNLLKFTPSNIMAHTYCLNEEQWESITKNVKPDTYIGPYKDCNKAESMTHQSYSPIYQNQHLQQQNQTYQYPYHT